MCVLVDLILVTNSSMYLFVVNYRSLLPASLAVEKLRSSGSLPQTIRIVHPKKGRIILLHGRICSFKGRIAILKDKSHDFLLKNHDV